MKAHQQAYVFMQQWASWSRIAAPPWRAARSATSAIAISRRLRQFPVKANEWKRLEAHLAILLSAVKQLSLPHERPKEIHVYSEALISPIKVTPEEVSLMNRLKGIKASINRLREAFGIKTDIATYDCTASERQNCLPHDRYLYCAQHNAVYLISAGFTMKSGHTQLNFDRRPIERQIERLNQTRRKLMWYAQLHQTTYRGQNRTLFSNVISKSRQSGNLTHFF